MKLTPTEIYAFSLPTWEDYYEFCTEKGVDPISIEGKEVFNFMHTKVEAGQYDVPGIFIQKESVNEDLQILDKVKYDGQRGYINGQIGGKWIVQIQGSTYLVDPDQLKEYNAKPDVTTKPHMKFDDKTQALLFEQYVKCGIYVGNVPIRLNDCFVKYSDYEKTASEHQLKVLIEGNTIFMPKDRVRILENINDFANPDNYVPGVIVDESGEAMESILVNAIDYTQAIGDADPIKIVLKTQEGNQEMQTMPKSKIRTLSV